MRSNSRPAVLSLFLLVPASIISAQTAHLTGTVTAEQDFRTVQFNSKQGNVNVLVPGILSYSGMGTVTLQGTVIAEPSGNSEKEKANNLKALQKMTLTIGQKTVSVLPGKNVFDFSVPSNLAAPVSIDLVDPGGNRATVELSGRNIPELPSTKDHPALSTEQKVFITDGYIPVYTANNPSTIFQPTDKFFIKSADGTMTEIPKCTQSPTQTILDGKGIKPGLTTIVRQSATRTDESNIRLASLSLTSPNTNLRSGQTSSLTVTVDPKITEKDTAEAMQIPVMSLDIKNLTPGVINLSGGNYQVMTFPTSSTPGSPSSWQTTRTITGVTPGGFNVSATLYPGPDNTSPVDMQLEEIKTAEEFNKWSNAIKKDLQAFLKDLPKDDFTRRDLVQRAIDYMPSVQSDAELDIAKIEARYLLRFLPGFRNKIAGEGFAAFQTYLTCNDRLGKSGAIANTPVHVQAIEAGLNVIQNQNRNPVSASIQSQVNSALQTTHALQQNYSAAKLSELSTALLSLNGTTFVTGLADVPAILYPYIVETNEYIGAQLNGHEVTPDKQEIRFYDDGAVIIYSNGVRHIFQTASVNGSSVKSIMAEYDNPDHPMPAKIDCDSLKRICKKTQALTIFWGNVYSVTEGKADSRLLNGVTKETFSQSSLLITRGWEMDCCTGEFKLKLFFQSMRERENISFSKTLSAGWGNPCPIPDDCPECKEKCEKDKEMKAKNK